MHGLVAWSGFLGAWLLVAGPVFQAVVELREEEFERDAVAAAATTVPKPPPVSGWWGLVPPARYALARHRGRTHRAAVFAALTPAQQRQVVTLITKARGWLIVAAGAFFIALKETWELHEAYGWSPLAFWLLLVAALTLALAGVAAQIRRADAALRGPRPER